jgi:hypothetical protein
MSDINSILKNLDWNTRRPFGWNSSPDADWKVIFTGTVLLVLFASMLNLAVFVRIDKGKLFATEEEAAAEIPTIDTEELKKTLTYYQNKAAEFRRLTGGGATVVVDPSL